MSLNYPNFNRIAMRIREKRKAKGMTQEKLAEHAGVTTQFIGFIEIGIKKPSFTTLFRIAESLGTTIDPFVY